MMVAGLTRPARSATVLVEAETFAERGGWVVDPQAMDVMGSPYLLAHGLGEPVADAVTTVSVPRAGTYRVWVRTMDWVARWKAQGAPGKFRVLVAGKPLPFTFGTQGADWHWQEGGTVTLTAGPVPVRLHDLTGFEGRCDAVVFSDELDFTPPNELPAMTAWRHELLGLPDKPDEAGRFDAVVVGGGVAGCTAAVSAARLGLKVALIQNRPVLGGNSSSEVQVWIQGRTRQQPYPVLGEIVDELNTRPKSSPAPPEQFGDAKKLKVVQSEPNISLYFNEQAFAVGMEGGRIASITARHTLTGRETTWRGRWFVDCTGDGTIGFLAGADYDYTTKGHLGSSNLWTVRDTGKPAPFPRLPWALDMSKQIYPYQLSQLGNWVWESGFDKDTVGEIEAIRDHNLRAMYSVWSALKNDHHLYPNHKLQWAAFIAGKRESRRLLGDVILKREDILKPVLFPDRCVPCTWTIDLHYPDPKQAKNAPGEEFLAVAKQEKYSGPYPIPYRCLYSRNIPNLFMAGRDISVDHEALGTIRVQATTGMMGEVVGRALSLCKKYDAGPRDVYEKHLDELITLFKTPLSKEPPPQPLAFINTLAGQVGANMARTARVTTPAGADAVAVARIHDGDTTLDNKLRWVGKPPLPASVEFAWDKPVAIAAARILSGFVSGQSVSDPITDFVLQQRVGQDWRDIPGTRVTRNDQIDWHARFAPVTATHVRLVVEKSPVNTVRLWEVELYAPLVK